MTIEADATEELGIQFSEVFASFRELAAQHREHVHPAVEAALPTASSPMTLDATVFLMHLRALGWSHTLRRLDDVFDFQAHSAGCRSLFEMVVDLVLLTRGGEPLEKLFEWEFLSRFMSAKKDVAFSGSDPVVRRTATAFVKQSESRVEAACVKFWDKKKPMRWTGKKLFDDAVRADNYVPLKLAPFWRENYQHLCWSTHGSGLVMVRTITKELFPAIAILAMNQSFHMLGHVIRLVLEHFRLFDQTWSGLIKRAYVSERLIKNEETK